MIKRGILKHGNYKRTEIGELFNWLVGENNDLISKRIFEAKLGPARLNRFGNKTIRDCLFEETVFLNLDEFERVGFINCTFNGDLQITDEAKTSRECRISIVSCIIQGDLVLNELNTCSTTIRSSNIQGDLAITDMINGHLEILGANNEEPVEVDGQLDLLGCNLNYLLIYETNVKHRTALFDNQVNNAHIQSGKKESLVFDNNRIDNLLIDTDRKSKMPSHVNLISLDRYNHDGTVTLQDVVIQELHMRKVGGKTRFHFSNLMISERWILINSVPASLTCLNIDFRGCKIFLDSTLLSNSNFSNISWPQGKLCDSFMSSNSSASRNSLLREVYRQLKHAMLRDGNHIDALGFYRNEMEAYRGYLKKNSEVDWQEKLIVRLSRYASDHGQSLKRPLIGLFGIHLVLFFILVLFEYNGFRFDIENHSWEAFLNQTGHFFMLLNPAHKFPTDAKNFNDWMLGIDFIMRLSSGFFIYHIIRASRKFAKV